MPIQNPENQIDNQESQGLLDNLDLMALGRALLRGWVLILAFAIIFGAVYYVYNRATVAPTYQADVLLYVNNSRVSIGSATVSVSSGDSSRLVTTYLVILKSRATLGAIIEEAGLSLSTDELSRMISANAVNATEIFRVTVTGNSPYDCEKIANTIAEVLPRKITEIMLDCNVKVVDYAIIPASSTGPNYYQNFLIGAAVGALLAAAILVIIELMVTRVRTESELRQLFPDIPIIGQIPDMDLLSSGKGNYSNAYNYGYGSYGSGGKEKR